MQAGTGARAAERDDASDFTEREAQPSRVRDEGEDGQDVVRIEPIAGPCAARRRQNAAGLVDLERLTAESAPGRHFAYAQPVCHYRSVRLAPRGRVKPRNTLCTTKPVDALEGRDLVACMLSFWAALAGAGVGVLGGLLGLGGAEFRLPLLVGIFGYALRRAISLNLAISFVAVLVAAAARWSLGSQPPSWNAGFIVLAMMVGGVVGAAVGSRWLVRLSDARLHAAVRTLLVGIGALLILEAAGSWASPGLPLGQGGRSAAAVVAGVGIGTASTLLGVAGGELIIPTLVLAFGVPIKAAGTLSLLISVPTIIVGLWHHRASGAFHDTRDVGRIVLPMALGTVLGSTVGGWLVVYAPAGGVKLLLGAVLIGSALRMFKVDRRAPMLDEMATRGGSTRASPRQS